MMREAQKQARVRIAASAVAYLATHAGKPCFKKTLFIPPKNANKTEREEAFKNKWQTDFLNRLAEVGVVEKTSAQGQIGYIGNEERLQRIINDLYQKDGSILSSLLWPDKKVDISETPTRTGLVAAVEEKGLAKKEEEPKETINKELIQVIQHFFKLVLENQNALNDNLTEGNEKSDENLKQSAELIKKIGSYNKRLETVESRMAEIVRGVQANQNVIKPAMEDVTKLADGLSKLEKLVGVLERQEVRTQALHDSVNELVGMYKEAQKDKLGDLLRRLETHTKESDQLRDMILDMVSTANEPEDMVSK